MTMDEALQILLDYGFTYDMTINEIYYHGERVGDFAGNAIWLCDFQPSLINFSYLQVHKTIITCSAEDSERRLREQIANLLDTPRRYEEFCRKERIENMKKYFKNKREEAMIEKAWSEVPSWREFSYDRS
jgi:hypothetical protein